MPLTHEEQAQRQKAKPLVDKLAAMKENWFSEPSLRHLSPRMVDALITYIETDVKGLARTKWTCLTLLLLLLPFALANSSSVIYLTAAGCLACWGICFVFGPTMMPQPAVHALTQTDDLRVLPTLILATRHSGAQNAYVYDAIFRLLDQVTEEHIGLLNDDAQQHLWEIMRTRHIVTDYSDRELTLRTLRALAAIGNHNILARIKWIAWPSIYPNVDRWLIDEARELIPVMEARLQRQQVPETLLRAADVPPATPDVLLRPAHAAMPEPAQQLLRASHASPEDAQG